MRRIGIKKHRSMHVKLNKLRIEKPKARWPRVLYLIEPDCVSTVGVHGHMHDALDS